MSLFVVLFVVVAAGVMKAMRTLANKRGERHLLGQALLATLVGILTMIATVSSVLIIPWIYWSLAGICVGYAQMVKREKAADHAGSDTLQTAVAPR